MTTTNFGLEEQIVLMTFFFKGKIDEVRISNTCTFFTFCTTLHFNLLSLSQVREVMVMEQYKVMPMEI